MSPELPPSPVSRPAFGYSRRAEGFTLVEVIVALVILSMIMLATVSALRTFGNTQTSLTRVTDRIDEIRSVSVFLRDTLEATVPGDGGAGGLRFGGTREPLPAYFKGSANQLQWNARVLFGESFGGTMLLRVAQEGDQLILQWQRPPVPVESAVWQGQPSRILVEGVQEFNVSYRPERAVAPESQWKGPGSPVLVNMVIKAGGRFWPELIVQVPR
jgi:general secretion pathway protein J